MHDRGWGARSKVPRFQAMKKPLNADLAQGSALDADQRHWSRAGKRTTKVAYTTTTPTPKNKENACTAGNSLDEATTTCDNTVIASGTRSDCSARTVARRTAVTSAPPCTSQSGTGEVFHKELLSRPKQRRDASRLYDPSPSVLALTSFVSADQFAMFRC